MALTRRIRAKFSIVLWLVKNLKMCVSKSVSFSEAVILDYNSDLIPYTFTYFGSIL